MASLVVMLVGWIVARMLALSGLGYQTDSWSGSLRFALALMFAFTAASHFHPRTRPDLVRMVPPNLPALALLVTATGGLELVGAIALLWHPSAPAAAYGDVPSQRPCGEDRPRHRGACGYSSNEASQAELNAVALSRDAEETEVTTNAREADETAIRGLLASEVDPILRTRKGRGLGVACSRCTSSLAVVERRSVWAVGAVENAQRFPSRCGRAVRFARPQRRQLPQPRYSRAGSLVSPAGENDAPGCPRIDATRPGRP